MVNRLDLLGRAVGQSYGYFDYLCGGNSLASAAALWLNNGISLPGGCPAYYMTNTYATALNATGDICGYGPGPVPMVWPDGANSTTIYSTLSTPGFTSGEATAINADSAIIGYAFSGTTAHAFRWKQSGNIWPTPEDLNFLSPSGVQTYAYAIADDGSIAGKTRPSSTAPFHAFKTAGQPFDLSSETIDMGTMGGTASEASDMNELKGTVGRSQLTNGVWRAFLLPISAPNLGNRAIYEMFGLPGVNRTDWSSAAYGVNKFGQVVGYSQIEDSNHNLIPRAVLYSDQTGVTIDLNNITLDCGQTPAGLGWTLTQAQAINDNDVIVGYGSLSGRSTAWILYPKFQD